MDIRFLAAASVSGTGVAPSVVSISDTTSTGNYGKTAGISIGSNGAFYTYIHNAAIETSKWITPQTNMSDYEVRATLSSGDTPTGTFDTWQALTASRTWTLTSTVVDETLSATVLIEIRWTGNNVVQDSATMTFNVTGPFTEDGGTGGNNDGGAGMEVV